jgi:hypothetical protein
MIYIVNELCDIDETYNNCHGAFTDKEEAHAKAREVFEQAKLDIPPYDDYDNWSEDEDSYHVWDDDNSITVTIDEVKLNISEEHSKQIAHSIIDVFETELESKDITLPDEHRTGEPTEARIFGITYYYFEDSIIEELDKI